MRPGPGCARYDEFLALNGRWKALCTSWQMRAGVPNDRSDTGYDDGLIAELGRIHEAAAALVDRMSALRPRFTGYAERLTDAAGGCEALSTNAFTGALTDSCHDVCPVVRARRIGGAAVHGAEVAGDG